MKNLIFILMIILILTGCESPTNPYGSGKVNNILKIYINPHPFSEHCSIRFLIPESTSGRLTLENMVGNEIKSLFDNKIFVPGEHNFNLDMTSYEDGLFVIHLETEKFGSVRKFILKTSDDI